MVSERAQFYRPIYFDTKMPPKVWDDDTAQHIQTLVDSTFALVRERTETAIPKKQDSLHNILNKLEKNKDGKLEASLTARQVARRVREAQRLAVAITRELVTTSIVPTHLYKTLHEFSIERDEKAKTIGKRALKTEIYGYDSVFKDVESVTGEKLNLWNISEAGRDLPYVNGYSDFFWSWSHNPYIKSVPAQGE